MIDDNTVRLLFDQTYELRSEDLCVQLTDSEIDEWNDEATDLDRKADLLIGAIERLPGAGPGARIYYGLTTIVFSNTFGPDRMPKRLMARVFAKLLPRLSRPPQSEDEEHMLLREAVYVAGVSIFPVYRNFMKSVGIKSNWTADRLADLAYSAPDRIARALARASGERVPR
jgi:hypothetical protein